MKETNCNAASIILAHNHPSGEADPSQDDLQMTKYLSEAARHVGVAIVDHIIIGDREFASIRTAPTAPSTQTYDVRSGASAHLSLGGGIVCTKGRLPTQETMVAEGRLTNNVWRATRDEVS